MASTLSTTTDWTFVLLSPTLDELSDLAPTRTTLRFERNRGALIKSMDVPHDTDGAAELANARAFGTPIILCYRRDTLHNEDAPQPQFAGKLQTITTDLDANTGVPIDKVTWADPFGVPLETSTTSADFNQASALTAQALIVNENAETPCGLRVGSVAPSTPTRQSDFSLQPISQAIYEFADLGDYALEIAYLDPRTNDGYLAEVSFAATTGSDLRDTVRLEAGDGTLANTLSVSEQTIPPVNKVTTTTRHNTTGAIVAYTITDPASVAKHGKFEITKDVGPVLNDADLGDKARSLLRPEWTQSVQFQPNPATAPEPFVNYWLSDTLGFLVDSYQLQVNAAEPVVAIEIDLDDNLQEIAHRIEYGEPRRAATQLIAGLAERVYWLEQQA